VFNNNGTAAAENRKWIQENKGRISTEHNMKRGKVTATAILLFVALAVFGRTAQRAKVRTFRGQIWDSVCAARGTHRKVEKMYHLPEDTEQCLLTCIERLGGRYVLYIPRTGETYQLDNQQQPKRYAGQKVKVTGTYDRSTNMLYLQEIVPDY
jgi:hypothetical protein